MSDWVKTEEGWIQSGGNAKSDKDLSGTRAEFDAIKDSLPDGSAFDTTDEEVGGGSSSGNNFIEITNTVGNESGFKKIADFPLGMNKNNTCIVSYTLELSNGVLRSGIGIITDNENGRFFFELRDDGLYLYNNDIRRYSLRFYLYITKVGD